MQTLKHFGINSDNQKTKKNKILIKKQRNQLIKLSFKFQAIDLQTKQRDLKI